MITMAASCGNSQPCLAILQPGSHREIACRNLPLFLAGVCNQIAAHRVTNTLILRSKAGCFTQKMVLLFTGFAPSSARSTRVAMLQATFLWTPQPSSRPFADLRAPDPSRPKLQLETQLFVPSKTAADKLRVLEVSGGRFLS